jgi:phosphopantothenoylcysteine decarboxylase/phosphopantothenate--cysteine ligase
MESITLLRDKRIILGVTGGIAVYKVCTLASKLTQAGAWVDVVMTEAATRFVAPLTFQSLTGHAVYTELWTTPDEGLPTHIAHVGLAHVADLLVVVPATANSLSKMASGLADNLLSTVALAVRCPVLAIPAMDVGMWESPATQANVSTLCERGVHFAGPAWGRMASGLEGLGRMLEPDEISGHIRKVLGRGGSLDGATVVVTAGPTREYLDPVRFISNPSSGRQGFAIAQAAVDLGANVVLVAGPTDLPTPVGVHRIDVICAQEMHDAVLSATAKADALVMAAAVGDYRPEQLAAQKIKKGPEGMALPLVRTLDTLSAVTERRALTGFPRVVVGFAAESENLVQNARRKLESKHLDLIVANTVTTDDAGFASETNRVTMVGGGDEPEDLPLMSKFEVAERVMERVTALLAAGGYLKRGQDTGA